jgi:hypothetical protein
VVKQKTTEKPASAATTKSAATTESFPEAEYLEDYLKDFQREFDDYVRVKMSWYIFVIFIAALVTHEILLFCLIAIPIVLAGIKKWKIWVMETEMIQDMGESKHWRVQWSMFEGYDNIYRKHVKKRRHEEKTIIKNINTLSSTFLREMSVSYEVLAMDEVKIPRPDLERMLITRVNPDGTIVHKGDLDKDALGKFLDDHYMIAGEPCIVGDDENGIVRWEPECETWSYPTGRKINKTAGELLELERQGYDVADPAVFQEDEYEDRPNKDKPTGRYWKMVNGVSVDPVPVENANIDANAVHVYRTIFGRYIEARVKSFMSSEDDDYYDIRTLFIMTPGKKEDVLKYIKGKVPRNGFTINVSDWETVWLQLVFITKESKWICTMDNSLGIQAMKLKQRVVQLSATGIERRIIDIQAKDLQAMKISMIAKEREYQDQEDRQKQIIDRLNHEAGHPLEDSDPDKKLEDAIKFHDHVVPKPEERWLAWVLVIICVVMGLVIGIALTVSLVGSGIIHVPGLIPISQTTASFIINLPK